MRLFVSYAHVDVVRVTELAAVLRAGGFDPWWDDRLQPGDDWRAELRQGISASDAFLYLLSLDSVESEWCKWELEQAAALFKPIIPILIREGTPIPRSLVHLQYLDVTTGLQNVDVARLVGKLGRLRQSYIPDAEKQIRNPQGFPSRFKQPLQKDYRTIAEAYFQSATPDAYLYKWQVEPQENLPVSRHILGIDFGTTQSSIAVRRNGITELIPNKFGQTFTQSAVAIASDGTPVIGDTAADLILQRPERGVLEVKRLFGQEIVNEFGGCPVLTVDGIGYTPIDLAAFILRQLRLDAQIYLQALIDKVVIAAPANFDQSQHAALMQAARVSGLQVTRVLVEPVAACFASGLSNEEDLHVLVYDLGGGTFDASIIECSEGVIEVKAVNGDTRLGGADFDRVIVDYCVQQFREKESIDLSSNAAALMRIRDAAEKAKITLAAARTTSINVPYIVSSGSTMLHLEVELTRTLYNEMTHGLVTRTIELSRAVLEDAGRSPETVDKVLVVGRASRAYSVSCALTDLFGHRLQRAPDHVVALGAALQGGVLSGDHTNNLLLDSVTHTLRVQVAGGRSTPVIVRNTTIPTKREVILTKKPGDQAALILRIVSGESSWIEWNSTLAELSIPCDTRDTSKFRIHLVFDIDAVSHLQITVESPERTCLAKASVGLRQDGEWQPFERHQTSRHEEVLMPMLAHPITLPPLPDSKRRDRVALQRWICGAATDLALMLGNRNNSSVRVWWHQLHSWLVEHPAGEVPPGFYEDQIFHIFTLERELLVDALEERFSANLARLRTCSSMQAMVEAFLAVE